MKSREILKWVFLAILGLVVLFGWLVWYVSTISFNENLLDAEKALYSDFPEVTQIENSFEHHGEKTQYSFIVEENGEEFIYVLDENYNAYPKEAFSQDAYDKIKQTLETDELFTGYELTSLIPFYAGNQILIEATLLKTETDSVIYANFDATTGNLENYTILGE